MVLIGKKNNVMMVLSGRCISCNHISKESILFQCDITVNIYL